MTVVDSIASAFTQITPSGMNPLFFWGAFVIVYAISFSALMKIKLFDENRRLVLVVSFVIALLVALSPVVSQVLSTSLPSVGLVIIFVVCVLLAINILSPGWALGDKSKNYVIITMFIILGMIFMSSIVGEQAITLSSSHINFFGTKVARADLEVVVAVVAVGFFIFLISGSIIKKGGGKKE